MNHRNFKFFAVGASATVALFALCFAIKAWTEPSSGSDGVGLPLNTSVNDQIKSGRLSIGPGSMNYWITRIGTAFGLLNDSGKANLYVTQDGLVGVGTTTPLGTFDVENSTNNAQVCLNGSCCSDLKTCLAPPSNCHSSWANGSCAGGTCGATQRNQYKISTPVGCDKQSQCVLDPACVQVCNPGTVKGCAKCNDKGTAWESTCHVNGSLLPADVCASWTNVNACQQVYAPLNQADCNTFVGWACNTSNLTDPLYIEFYMDTTTADGYLGHALANSAPVNQYWNGKNGCGGSNINIGFKFDMPVATMGGWSVHDGQRHQIYMVAKQSDGSGWYMMPTVTLICAQQ